MKEVKNLEKLENPLFTPLTVNQMKAVRGGKLHEPTANVTGHRDGSTTADAPVEDCPTC